MSFREKMAVAEGLFQMARRARLEAARRTNPGLSEGEYDRIVAREFARTRI